MKIKTRAYVHNMTSAHRITLYSHGKRVGSHGAAGSLQRNDMPTCLSGFHAFSNAQRYCDGIINMRGPEGFTGFFGM